LFFCSNIREGGTVVIKVGWEIEEQEAAKGKPKKKGKGRNCCEKAARPTQADKCPKKGRVRPLIRVLCLGLRTLWRTPNLSSPP
jgi:hypothetical protein